MKSNVSRLFIYGSSSLLIAKVTPWTSLYINYYPTTLKSKEQKENYIKKFEGKKLSGSDFNVLSKKLDLKLYHFTNQNEEDEEKDSEKAIKFISQYNTLTPYNISSQYRTIIYNNVPNKSKITVHENGFSTNYVILGNKEPIQTLPLWKEEDYCIKCIENEPKLFTFIPDIYKTKKICEYAVKRCGSNFLDVPDKFKTLKMCIDVLDKHSLTLENMPDKFNEKYIYDETKKLLEEYYMKLYMPSGNVNF